MFRSLLRLGIVIASAGAMLLLASDGVWYKTLDSARMAMRHVNRVVHLQLGHAPPVSQICPGWTSGSRHRA